MHRRSIRAAATVVGLIVLTWPLSWANASPPVAVDPALTAPATLRYELPAGQTWQYGFSIDLRRLVVDDASGREELITMTGTANMGVALQSVDGDGNTAVFVTVDDADFQGTLDGEEVSTSRFERAFQETTTQMLVSPQGSLVDVELSEMPVELADIQAPRVSDPTDVGLYQLPTEPVAVGDQWTQSLTSADPAHGIRETIDLTLTFLGYAQLPECTCAVLQVMGDSWKEVSESGSLGELAGPGLGRGTSEAYAYIDTGEGRLVWLVGDSGLAFQASRSENPLTLTRTTHWELRFTGAR